MQLFINFTILNKCESIVIIEINYYFNESQSKNVEPIFFYKSNDIYSILHR